MIKGKRPYTMTEAALAARRKGGQARAAIPGKMSRIGRKGADSTWSKYRLEVGPPPSGFYMVDRTTGQIVAKINC